MRGRIIKNQSDLYTVEADNNKYVCKARGKFRNNQITPIVGDMVLFDEEKKYILDIDKRKNFLNRPTIANVDASLILTSAKRPDFAPYLLDKMIVSSSIMGIKPIIIITKYDLLSEDEKKLLNNTLDYYKRIGYDLIINTQLDELKKLIDGKIVVLTGQSGVGKSTLLNHLDSSLSLKTDDISDALNRGKHTTRHVELFDLKYAYIADTPGFSAFDIDDDMKKEIRFFFPEFQNDKCKYRDCLHMKEDCCQVKKDYEEGLILKSRYESYLNMVMK